MPFKSVCPASSNAEAFSEMPWTMLFRISVPALRMPGRFSRIPERNSPSIFLPASTMPLDLLPMESITLLMLSNSPSKIPAASPPFITLMIPEMASAAPADSVDFISREKPLTVRFSPSTALPMSSYLTSLICPSASYATPDASSMFASMGNRFACKSSNCVPNRSMAAWFFATGSAMLSNAWTV